LDFRQAVPESVEVLFPLEIHKFLRLFPGSIIVVAGEKSQGKTAVALNIIKMNMDKWKIKYMTSELHKEELRDRLDKHEDVKIEDWNFRAVLRSSNFPDLIEPDNLNIIDWIGAEFIGEEYNVGRALKGIFDKLNKGIAVVFIQKDKHKEFGRGAGYTRDLSRVYIVLADNYCKLIDVKSFRGQHSPNGLMIHYKLINGAKFIPEGEWMSEEAWESINKKQSGFKFGKIGDK